jgi:predicted glycosyltransferase
LRIWIDVLTPKQVLFFAPVVEEFRASGCEVIATSRRYREIEPIARMQGLDLKFVGERGGSDPKGQLVAATQRQNEIIPLIDDFKPTVSFSVASGVCARVSFGLGIKHMAVNDSPHSIIAGRLSLPLSEHLFCPWIIPYKEWTRFGLRRSQITPYRALDPAAWLKRKAKKGPVPPLDEGKKTITVRLEESYAPYMAGTSKTWIDSVLKMLEEGFPYCNLVALCRYGEQLEHVKREFGSHYIVPKEVIDGRGLLEQTDVFVGMGGTMSAEAALMGVPTVSTFQGSLYTERYLASAKLLTKAKNLTRLITLVRRGLDEDSRVDQSERAKRILRSMEDPVSKIVQFVLRHNNIA